MIKINKLRTEVDQTEVNQKEFKKENKPKLLITGGGSGGHVSAAKAVISHLLKEKKWDKAQIIYLGSKRGMIGEVGVKSIEQKMIQPLGLKFYAIDGGKIHRFLTLDQIRQFVRFLKGFFDSYKVIKAEKPDILLSTGGFITVPPIIIAKLFKVPIVLHEQTVVSGLANRIASKFADKICISHETSSQDFPKEKIVVTGNPINKRIAFNDIEMIKDVDPELKEKIKTMGEKQDEFPIVFLTGGAQGAHQLNEAIFENLDSLLKKYSLILQVGSNVINKDYERFQDRISQLPRSISDRIYVMKMFGDEFGPIINQVDIVVSRGGANILDEIEISGKRTLVIPLDGVSGDEQFKNSQRLVKGGQAVVVREGEFDSNKLHRYIEETMKLKQKPPDNSKLGKAEEKITEILYTLLGQ